MPRPRKQEDSLGLVQWIVRTAVFCVFYVTTDKSAKDIIKITRNNSVKLELPERIILIANHQGMQFFQFIFLKRNWAVDKGPLTKQMTRFARSNDPLWLLIFPEGTIVSEETRVTSKKFADKTGLVDHKYVLLPRSTGLHFCKSALGKSIDYLYDLTIGLEGVSREIYPQDIYTLRSIYFEEIPQDEDKFTIWLRDRWSEKDVMMEEFYKNGRFSSYESPRIVPMRENLEGTIKLIIVPTTELGIMGEQREWSHTFSNLKLLKNMTVIVIKSTNTLAYKIMSPTENE
ncbi:3106_t:CDS:2, partial [Entrophospora sp. SA101]